MSSYKHNEKINFKGLVYRYNKSYREFRLVTKWPSVPLPETLLECSNGWIVGPLSSDTPEKLLEKHLQMHIDMQERDLLRHLETVATVRATIKKLKSKDLT